MRNKVALIFGVTGQAGYYLSKSLLKDDYYVCGVVRRSSVDTTFRIKNQLNNPNFWTIEGDITDSGSIYRIINTLKNTYFFDNPLEIYNLAAMSHVATSFEQPKTTWDITAQGHINLLECIRNTPKFPVKIFFAASSEMFGFNVDPDGFQRITTAMAPNSPYSIAKLAAFHANRLYRNYELWTVSGVLFNMESPMRGDNFVTKKIARWFGNWHKSNYSNCCKLQLGNILSKRDWSHCEDSVEAMRLMMAQSYVKDYVISSMETRSVEDFVYSCHNYVKGLTTEASNFETKDLIDICPSLYRPCEVPYLLGDSNPIRKELGWKPKHDFNSLVKDMMDAETQTCE